MAVSFFCEWSVEGRKGGVSELGAACAVLCLRCVRHTLLIWYTLQPAVSNVRVSTASPRIAAQCSADHACDVCVPNSSDESAVAFRVCTSMVVVYPCCVSDKDVTAAPHQVLPRVSKAMADSKQHGIATLNRPVACECME